VFFAVAEHDWSVVSESRGAVAKADRITWPRTIENA
jgi:hypothetical protein